MIPPLKLTDTAAFAMLWFDEFRTNQLPVVSEGKFLGLITEEQILDLNDDTKLIGEFELSGEKCTVHENQFFYDVIRIAVDNHVDLVGVLDESKKFIGVITIQDTITAFAQTTPFQAPGSVVVLSMYARDYSLAEISRLIEENNARILSSSIKYEPTDTSRLKVTLKINQEDISAIIATLERFDYKIISRFQETEVTETDKGRIDELLKYINI